MSYQTISKMNSDITMPGTRSHSHKVHKRFAMGDVISNRYKVVAELGQGGMGVVYKCFDETAGIEVALKALPPELSHNTLEMEDIKDNFQLVYNLHHPNIASSNTLEKDKINDTYYLIMECAEGEDLRRWIKRKRKEGTLTLDAVIPVIRQVAKALDYAHDMKVIHRDIKPGNIMINQAGDVKVLDFGLAAQIHTSMTRISMAYHGTSGTGPYMAPEQWRGRAQGAAADQYALAVMTYEMLAGHLPFESADAAILQQAVLTQEPEEIPGIPGYAQEALKRALDKVPTERFVNCRDFVAALSGKKMKLVKTYDGFSGIPGWFIGAGIFVLLGFGGMGYYGYTQHQKNVRLEWLAQEKERQEQEAKLAEEKRLKDEKVAREQQEQQAQLAREKEKKEQQAQLVVNEKKKNELIQENYRLQPRVKNKKLLIESANYDRGQTFGKHLDALSGDFSTAERAESRGDPISANHFYKTAEAEADWIIANAPLREEVRELQQQVSLQKEEADKFDGAKLFYSVYQEATGFSTQANEEYEIGNFKKAKEFLQSALNGYQKAYAESRNLILENLVTSANLAQQSKQWDKIKEIAEEVRVLDSAKANELIHLAEKELIAERLERELEFARQAKVSESWQSVYDYAVSALNIDKTSREAEELKREAESFLKPALEIIAMVDNQRVPAIIQIDGKSYDTSGHIFNDLVEDTTYQGTLSYQINDTEYVGKINFKCDWHGPKKINVALSKLEFSGSVDCNGMELKMVLIKAGSFMMGSPDMEKGRSSNEKQHRVTLTKDYWIGQYEVTQAQYEAIMGENPSGFKGPNRPVEKVSWHDAKAFCEKLNEQYAGKLPKGYRFDLPTEAQWEYACRAGTTTALNNGKNLTSEKYSCLNLNEVACYTKNHDQEGHQEVGKKRSNAWGLYDMHGNVWEWCRDWYGSYNGDATNPQGPNSGMNRVYRGGSWSHDAWYCRSATRSSWKPEYCNNYLGFRLAFIPIDNEVTTRK